MNDDTIRLAEAEARRFLERAKAARDARAAIGAETWRCTPRESGALRRASLDLTRALAEMRKS